MTFRWGLIGHGYISGQFLAAVDAIENAHVVAVAGRDPSRVATFATSQGVVGVTRIHDLIAVGVDAVYVCTPHTAHLDAAIECLAAGVPVLVEKPMTPTAADTRRLAAAAREHETFAMEAVWTRFLPIYDEIRQWIAEGRIGDVQLITASFGFAADPNPDHRLFAPALAGGSILDVGLYPLTLAEMICGGPAEELRAVGRIGATGVDEQVAIVGSYPGGVLAHLTSAICANLEHSAVLQGTRGSIHIPWFWGASSARLVVGDHEEAVERPHPANGFEYEIQHVMDRVAEGAIESEIMSLDRSIAMAEQTDDLRAQIGLRYPFERNVR